VKPFSDTKILPKANANIALLWYFVLLWEVFPRSKQIGFVLKAVIMGGSQVIHTAPPPHRCVLWHKAAFSHQWCEKEV
jgi:hypothetical protein